MKRTEVIIVLLLILSVASLLFNGFLLKEYYHQQSNKIEIEKALIMNEFSERTKEWRTFNSFLRQLTKLDVEQFPISKEQSNLYWELAFPAESIVMKATSYIREADYDSYNDYGAFINQFDSEFKLVVTQFKSILPLMNRDQLNELTSQLDETYDMYINEALINWGIGYPEFFVNFEPDKEKLEEVINELKLVRENLEAIK